MTTAVKDRPSVDMAGPVSSATFGIKQAEQELKNLEEREAGLRKERLSIISESNTEAPGIRSKLANIESELGSVQTLQDRASDKLKLLTDELPQLRKEAEEKIEELIELEERIEELAAEVKTVNHSLWELCNSATGSKISGLASKRTRLVAELEELPSAIRDITGFFHMAPEMRQIDIPDVDQKVVALGEALQRLEKE